MSFPFVAKVFAFIHQGFPFGPFGYQSLPFGNQGPLLHLHYFEVKCDEERTNEERTYGPDGITNHVCY